MIPYGRQSISDEDVAADHGSKKDHCHYHFEALWLIQLHHQLSLHSNHKNQSGKRMGQPPEGSCNSREYWPITECERYRRADRDAATKRANPKLDQKATFQKIYEREQEE